MSKSYSHLTLISVFCILQINAIVKVGVYYETLCPYSRAFVLDHLVPTYKELSSKMSIEFNPYGNARFTKVDTTDGQFDVNTVCQHGVQECLGNRIHSCILSTESTEKSLEYFNCMWDTTDWKQPAVIGEECAKTLNLNWTSINECAYGPLGRGLLLVKAGEHYQLDPKLNYVPWITFNGVHTEEMNDIAITDLFGLITNISNTETETPGSTSSSGTDPDLGNSAFNYSFATLNLFIISFIAIQLYLS